MFEIPLHEERLTVVTAAELISGGSSAKMAKYLGVAHTMIEEAGAQDYILDSLDDPVMHERWGSENTSDYFFTAFLDKPAMQADHFLYLGAARYSNSGRRADNGVMGPIARREQGSGALVSFYKGVPQELGWVVNSAAGMLDSVSEAA